MHQIPGLLMDRHNGRGPVVGAVGAQVGAVAENQRSTEAFRALQWTFSISSYYSASIHF